ncbi:hypothetical protein LNKW23_29970 [Paralimibaculum aggregatum]|uniref:DUF6647 domain-containing protein n=1 Tax=Paralimibaculum aggregatum TaxID=3036245 RepID=A0ABQ6LR18_9RHOB|nr:DUF6647 family protein [Limibaculum sp. NKW23]GMG83783.1 hypothetical protein LNKW23_29970 [Limibaculum sp. NKW23]
MPLTLVSGPLRAGLAVLVLLAASAAAAADPDRAALRSVVKGLERWLDRAAPYPRPMEAPAIVFIDAAEARAMHRRAGRLDGRLRGLYAATGATIYLVRPWSPRDPRDVSALLHELVHHRQTEARHWYCENAQEWEAYRLQARWLGELGIDPGFYWPAILLEASCTPRDIHPD